MFVPDQFAERDFYELFGFERHYEGVEFPGFVAIRHGQALVGLQRASTDQPPYGGGLRWQFEVESTAELDHILDACKENGLQYQLEVEEGGDRFRTRLVRVMAPSGVTVWFEGPNER
jgi:catechol 2,3-dioxygenase-like lactoylglutathione lyase family enzyme